MTERRRQEILDAAALAFASDGYQNTDLQVLADRLKVAKGTLYRYFPSKRELFLAAVDRGVRLLHDQVEASAKGVSEPLARLELAMTAYFKFFDDHPELIELFIQERAEFRDRKTSTYFEHSDANAGPWIEMFAGLIQDGAVRTMPVERIMNALGNLVYGTLFTTYFRGKSGSLEAQTRDLLDIVLFGILSNTERSKLQFAPDQEFAP